MNALVIGELLWDIYPDKKCIGGAAFNFAAHCVGEGLSSSLLTGIGKDSLGEETLRVVSDFGIDTSLFCRSEKGTGRCTVTLDENKIPSYHVHTDTAYDNICLDADILDEIIGRRYDMLYFGTLIQRAPLSRDAVRTLLERVSFSEVFCDINLRTDCYDTDSVAYCLEHATILKISDEEEPLLRQMGFYDLQEDTPQGIAAAIATRFSQIKVVIVTLGKKGALAYRVSDGAFFEQESIGSEVVSTVGAGDSFGAAFMASYLRGESLSTALYRGALLSGYVVAHAEAVPKGRP